MADYMAELFNRVKKKGAEKKPAQETEQKKQAPEAFIPKATGPAVTPPAKTPAQQKPFAKTFAAPSAGGQQTETAEKTAEAGTREPRALQTTNVVQTLEEVKKQISEMKKAPEPPQSRATEQAQEDEPERSVTEAEIERADKSEIDSYGTTKIYKLHGQPLLYYWTPVARPGGGEKAIINTIKEVATRVISIAPYKIRDPEQRRNVYFQRILEIINNSPELNIPRAKYEFYADAVVREMVGYGIIDSLIKDDRLEEIMVIGPNMPVYVFHRKYEMMITNIEFFSDSEIQDLVNRIARQIGRRVDISSPLLDARLPDGSRVNATIPPATVEGTTLTIRKFREEPYSIIDLMKENSLDSHSAAFLWLITEGMGARPANILISGGTGAGKTTLLNVLAAFIPDTERVISIEDTAELNLPMKHWIRMEARPPGLEGTGELTLDILTKNSLRMRPDRIIVGEVRHDEAFTLFTAFNTGHDGCLTPETKIALTSGIREIGEFTDQQIEKNGFWKEGKWEVCNVDGNIEHINSMDDKGKASRQKIIRARRKPYTGEVYHIKLASGSEITCTPNHPVYTFSGTVKQLRADELKEGQHLATPGKLLREENASETETEYWSGLLHGDGNITYYQRHRRGKNGKEYICNEGSINLYTEEEAVIPKFINYMKENLDGTHVKVVHPRPEKQCYEAHISGYQKTGKIMKLLDMPAGSRQKAEMSNSHYTNDLRGFVAGFFDAEGHVDANNNAIVISCANENYVDFFRYALLTEGITSRKYESRSHNSRWYRLYIYGIGQVEKFYKTYPIKFDKKIRKIQELLGREKKRNTSVDLIECNDAIIEMLGEAKQKGYSNSEIARKAGITQGIISFYKRKERTPSRSTTKALANAFESIGVDSSKLRLLADSDIFWDKIVGIHSFPYNGFVYDLTVSEGKQTGMMPHNFVAQGIIVGNSLGTVHANSPEETIVRVTNPPMNVPKVMLSGLNFIVVIHRMHDNKRGTIRRITEIAEVVNALRGSPKTNSVYKWEPAPDRLKRTDEAMEYMITLSDLTGNTKKQIEEEIEARAVLLSKLMKENVTEMREVTKRMKDFLIAKR